VVVRKRLPATETLPPLWTCPKCRAKFVSANMWHSCGRFRLEDLFARSDPSVFALFKKFRRIVERCGPVTMIPQKTRVVFMVRMRFAGATVRKSNLRIGLIMRRRLEPDPRLEKVEVYGPLCVGHYLRIERPEQLDDNVRQWVREAYDCGIQKGFERRGNTARRIRGNG
jgi:Domain of unknown function (DUF5655)